MIQFDSILVSEQNHMLAKNGHSSVYSTEESFIRVYRVMNKLLFTSYR